MAETANPAAPLRAWRLDRSTTETIIVRLGSIAGAPAGASSASTWSMLVR